MVKPPDFQDGAKAALVEGFECPQVLMMGDPGFGAVEQRRDDKCLIDFDFCF